MTIGAALDDAFVDLYWLPLGAGGRSVRCNGRVFEAIVARHEHRPARDLYHSALEVRSRAERFVIEVAPCWGAPAAERGAVREGPVGLRALGRSRFFRYEVRCWRDGLIPDVTEAVDSPRRVSAEAAQAEQVLALCSLVPTLTWGRDELRAGDMWNSNSVVAWLLARSGHDMSQLRPPPRGRAPGWDAGLVLADRQRARSGAGSPR